VPRWIRTTPDDSGQHLDGSHKLMDLSHEDARERLLASMKLLREEVGNPSLGDLVKQSGKHFSKSTLDDHLSGRRTQLPSWRLVAAYVSACHESAKLTGIDTIDFETLEEWRTRWLSALRGDESTTVSTYAVSRKDLEDLSKLQNSRAMDRSTIISRNEHTGEITGIMLRLEEDLSRLGDSLPIDTGLFVVLSGPIVGTRFAVERDTVTLGRHHASDVLLDHVTVSRKHAEVHRNGEQFTICDAGSSNGTFLRQVRLADEMPLASYDEVQLGIFKLLFVQGEGSHRRNR
jgi:FHA domain